MVRVRIVKGTARVDGRLQAHLKRRLDLALGGFSDHVGHIVVRLSQAQPARSKPFKHCEIEVVMRPRCVSVADTGADIFVAVENAAHRLKRAFVRALEREHAWTEGHPALPAQAASRRRKAGAPVTSRHARVIR